jgi:hypothetical protein
MGRRIAGIAALWLAVAAGPARAQAPVEIRVVAAGMSVAGIEVYVLVEGEPWALGATDGEGRVTAPGDLVGLRPGDPVEVHQLICAEGRTLLIVPSEESADAECERRRREDGSCDCGSLGIVGWGGDMAIDLVAEEPEPPQRVARGGGRPLWVAGLGAGWSSWPNLDQACAAAPLAASCSLEAEGPTFRASLEARRDPDSPFSLMAAVGFTPNLAVAHAFAPSASPREPRASEAELQVLTFEGYAVGRARAAGLDVFLALGYVWAYDRIEATTTFGTAGLTATEDRSDSGGRLGGRAGADWWPAGRRWGARLEVGGMVGEEEDVDAGWSAVGMVLLPLGDW